MSRIDLSTDVAEASRWRRKGERLRQGGFILPPFTGAARRINRGWPQVATALHFDGNLTCQKGKTWTANGSAAASGTMPRFGSGSLRLPGSGSFLFTPAVADFQPSSYFSGSFWMRADSVGTSQRITGVATNAGGDAAWGVQMQAGTNVLRFLLQNNAGTYFVVDSAAISAATWYFVEFCKDLNTLRLFVNGTMYVGGTAFSGTMRSIPSGVAIGRLGLYAAEYFTGYIDEYQVMQTVGNTAAYTVPDEAFPNT